MEFDQFALVLNLECLECELPGIWQAY